MLEKLQGKKTYLLLIAYIVVMLVTNQPADGDAIIGNIDPAALKEALIAGAMMTAKAAFNRFSS